MRSLLRVSIGLLILGCGDDPIAPRAVARVQVIAPVTTLSVGDATQLVAGAYDDRDEALPNTRFVWSSSNTAALVVDSLGNVRAIGAGDAEIRATASSGMFGAVMLHSVSPVARILVSGAHDVIIGDTVRLTARALDSGNAPLQGVPITWTSSNSAIAVVDSTGLVRGVAYGDAIITARAHGSVQATATIGVGTFRLAPGAERSVVNVNETGTCAVSSDFQAYCWGNAASSTVPLAQVSPVEFRSVYLGGNHKCGLDANGVAYCWGNNFYGQLGLGPAAGGNTPEAITGVRFSSLSLQDDTSCGVGTDQTVYCWGDGYNGRLGDGVRGTPGAGNSHFTHTPRPVSIPEPMAAVATGKEHVCGVAVSGSIYCWGTVGPALGNGGVLEAGATPPVIGPERVGSDLHFARIDADIGTCALTSVGKAYCWGGSYSGRPQAVGGANTSQPFTAIATTAAYNCGLMAEGVAHCWGAGAPAATLPGVRFASLDIAGPIFPFNNTYSHGCGITTDGRAYCWGSRQNGQLGDGLSLERPLPVAVAGSRVFTHIAAMADANCAIAAEQNVFCWGANDLGQIGDGTSTDRFEPTMIASNRAFRAIAADGTRVCALDTAGTPYCWGATSLTGVVNTPVAVATQIPFTQIATGSRHACALTSEGAAYCWGENDFNQLGDGSTTSSNTPVPVSGNLRFIALDAFAYHTCGITTTGDLYCWGRTFDPALFTTDAGGRCSSASSCSAVPRHVPGLSGLRDVGLGAQTRCVVNSDSMPLCWGAHIRGFEPSNCEVGPVPRTSFCVFTPELVVGARQLMSMSRTSALDTNGVMVGFVPIGLNPAGHFWLLNAPGELRYRDASGTCGITLDSRAYCWGNNERGQVGDGVLPVSSIPVPALTTVRFSTGSP